MFRYIKPFLKAHFRYTFSGLVILIGIDALQLVTPEVLGRLSDDLTNKTLTTPALYKYLAIILGLAFLIAFGRYWWRMLITGTSRKAEYWLRKQIFEHLERLNYDYFNHHKVGDLMALATNDVTTVGQAMGMGLVMLIDASFMTVMTVGLMMINIDPKLTLYAVMPLPMITLLVGVGGRLVRKRFKKVQEAFSHMTDMVQESFSGIRIIKAYTREDYQKSLFEMSNQENYIENMRLIRLWGLVFPMVKTISGISLIVALSLGTGMVIDGEISVGSFVAFISYIGMLTWPMMAVGWVVNIMERGYASLGRINEFLEVAPSITYGTQTVEKNLENDTAIKVEQLSFAYEEGLEPVLKEISFEIKRGEKIGMIGRTGSGKTTLVHLLMKNWAVKEGCIYIEGKDIHALSKADLKAYFAVMPQDNFLFSRNIDENIRFFEPHLASEDVLSAAKVANIHDEILSFKEGYETLLGERGVNLSGGQKQRIGIARALAKRGEMLILDDALSAVDTKTEEAILRHLRESLASKTALIISHRISAIKECDQIFVMDEGRIVARGKHENLIHEAGLYQQLYEQQLLEEKIQEE